MYLPLFFFYLPISLFPFSESDYILNVEGVRVFVSMGKKEGIYRRNPRRGKTSMEQTRVSRKKQGNQAKAPILQQNRRNTLNHSGPRASYLTLKEPCVATTHSESRPNFPTYNQRPMLNIPAFVTLLSPCIYFQQV